MLDNICSHKGKSQAASLPVCITYLSGGGLVKGIYRGRILHAFQHERSINACVPGPKWRIHHYRIEFYRIQVCRSGYSHCARCRDPLPWVSWSVCTSVWTKSMSYMSSLRQLTHALSSASSSTSKPIVNALPNMLQAMDNIPAPQPKSPTEQPSISPNVVAAAKIILEAMWAEVGICSKCTAIRYAAMESIHKTKILAKLAAIST